MNSRSTGPNAPHPHIAEERWAQWDRRDFMVAAGATIGGLTMSADISQAKPADAISTFLIAADARIAASRAFASEAARFGQHIAWIEGDVTSLYEELDARWRDEKIAVAGLTAYGAFFCLERLGMDRGLRVVFKGEHRCSGDRLIHAVTGPEDVVTEQALASLSDDDWPAKIARLAMASRNTGRKTSHLRRSAAALGEQPPLLLSWAIAPKRERLLREPRT